MNAVTTLINALAPGDLGYILTGDFQTNFNGRLMYLLWNCGKLIVTEPH